MDSFLRENLLISVCEGPNAFVEQVRSVFAAEERLARPGKLLHRLLDAMVDRYLPVLDMIEERIEHQEEKAIGHTSPKLLSEVFTLKRSLIEFRRVTISMRDMFSQLVRRNEPWLQSEALYFRDIYDHLMRAMEFTETYRDILTGVLEVLVLYRKRERARRRHEHGVFARFRYNDLKGAGRDCGGRGPYANSMV